MAAHATTKPPFAVPPGACDCHFHVFGPAAAYPYAPERTYTPPDASLESYLAMLDALGVERMVFVQPSVYGTDNRRMLDAMAEAGERCRGVAVVAPDVPEAELRRLHEAGVRGVRLNIATSHGAGAAPGALDALERLADRVAPLGWHVQLFVAADLLPDLAPRLRSLAVECVIDHMGLLPAGEEGPAHPGFRALGGLLREGRCWVKLSAPYRISKEGPPYRDVPPLARALAEAGPERAVWASDWPHTGPHGSTPSAEAPALEFRRLDPGVLLGALGEWAPDEAARRRILVDNPARLYGFA